MKYLFGCWRAGSCPTHQPSGNGISCQVSVTGFVIHGYLRSTYRQSQLRLLAGISGASAHELLSPCAAVFSCGRKISVGHFRTENSPSFVITRGSSSINILFTTLESLTSRIHGAETPEKLRFYDAQLVAICLKCSSTQRSHLLENSIINEYTPDFFITGD